MQKLLFVKRTRGVGGLTVVLLDWLAGIDYSRTSVVLASHQMEFFSRRLGESGLPVQCLDLPSPETGSFWRVFPKWMSFFSSVRPQKIVLLEGIVPDFSFPVFLAARCATPELFVFETSAPWPLRKITPSMHFGFMPGLGLWRYQEICNVRIRGYLATKTLTASYGTRDKMAAYYGYPSKNCRILHHGVDTERFTPSPDIRREFRLANGIPENALVIVSHGRFDRNKRVDRIIQAFHILSAEHKNLWLLLTAHGPLKEPLEQEVARINNRDRVKLLGFQEDISRLVQASDIYVLASENEGFGIALVEAMSAGLVCVATNVSGPGDIITDNRMGFLVKESDAGVLEGIRCAVELSEDQRESIRCEARKTVVERFDLQLGVRRALESMGIPSRPTGGEGGKLTTQRRCYA